MEEKLMYSPKHFALYEMLPPEIYGSDMQSMGRGWRLFDNRILITADRLRHRYGKMICNTWWWGGNSTLRGLRPWHSPVGARYSQHKFGRALDLIPHMVEAEEIREDIRENPDDPTFEYITALELEISWLHVDCRNHDKKQGLFLFTP